jgi:hypothetical protein
MGNSAKLPPNTTRLVPPRRQGQWILGTLFSLAAADAALAQPGYANNVRTWCANAGRPAPVFAADECSTCHSGNGAGQRAYLSKNLDFFCPMSSATNSAPSLKLTPSGAQTVVEGKKLTITATASDPDKNPVTLSAAPLPKGATFGPATGVFAWTPATGSHGVYSVTFKATDKPSNGSQAKTAQQTVTITVTSPAAKNTAPVLDSIVTPQNAAVGKALNLTITASDVDDDKLVLSASKLPAGAKFTTQGLVSGKWTGKLTWTPSAAQAGLSYTSTFLVKETGVSPALQDSQNVVFKVAPAGSSAMVDQVTVTQTRYRAGVLDVQGQVQFSGNQAASPAMTVNLSDDSGAWIGQAPVSANGQWSLAIPMASDDLPCSVVAEADGVRSSDRPVSASASACPALHSEGDDGDEHEHEHDGESHGHDHDD